MDVSIIIVNYNQGNMTRECILSVKQFTPPSISLEFIVVDNSDREKLAPFLVDLDQVKLIENEENRGFAAANNQGLALASGEYLLFLNNDTLFVEDSLSPLLTFHQQKEKPVFIGCKLLNSDRTHQVSLVDFDTLLNNLSEAIFVYKLFPRVKALNRYHWNYNIPTKPTKVDIVKGAFILAKTAHVRALGGFDERFFFYSEEYDLCWRLIHQLKGEVWYYPETAIIHLGGATTASMKWFSMYHIVHSKLQYLAKNTGGWKRVLFFLIHYLTTGIRIPIYLLGGVFGFKKSLLQKSWMYLRTLFIFPSSKSASVKQ